jgi:hypothetical protein
MLAMGIFHVVRLAERERTVIAFFADETSPKLVGA